MAVFVPLVFFKFFHCWLVFFFFFYFFFFFFFCFFCSDYKFYIFYFSVFSVLWSYPCINEYLWTVVFYFQMIMQIIYYFINYDRGKSCKYINLYCTNRYMIYKFLFDFSHSNFIPYFLFGFYIYYFFSLSLFFLLDR